MKWDKKESKALQVGVFLKPKYPSLDILTNNSVHKMYTKLPLLIFGTD